MLTVLVDKINRLAEHTGQDMKALSCSWGYFVLNYVQIGTETVVPNGEVLKLKKGIEVVYRFIGNDDSDVIYRQFDGTNLTEKITARGE